MAIYTSRFSNPALRSGEYQTIRISVGKPRWELGYKLDGDFPHLMPYGLFDDNNISKGEFSRRYVNRLNDKADIIINTLKAMSAKRDIVLLCYEDIRKPGNWCHREVFADWWYDNTGKMISELTDPSNEPKKESVSPFISQNTETHGEQTSLF